MSATVIKNIIRFALLLLFQIGMVKQVKLSIGNFDYIHIMVYPLALMLLPISTPRSALYLIAFVYGLMMDSFYNSPGVHASASLFMVFFRIWTLKLIEPFEGYGSSESPRFGAFGFTWFLSYSAILLFIHHFFYFSVEAFTFVYFFDIFLNTVFSFLASWVLILLLEVVTGGKD